MFLICVSVHRDWTGGRPPPPPDMGRTGQGVASPHATTRGGWIWN